MHELTEYYPFIIQNSEHFLQARRTRSSHVLPIINVPHFQPSFPRKKMYRFLKKEERKKISIHILTHTHGCTKLAPHELSCDRDANCTLTHSSLPISHRNARRKASSSSWSRRSRARRVIVWFLVI